MASSEDVGNAVRELGEALGERLHTTMAAREYHSRDESHHSPHLPDAVVVCANADEVVEVLRICSRHRVPVVPVGTNTGLEGGSIPVDGGISLDLSQMNEVLRVNAEDLNATVQAGVTLNQLNQRLGAEGLFFPVDPGTDASFGGMAATRASGTNTVRYGTMRDNVLALAVVLADGRVVRTGGLARKSAAGYDLTRLFVGSEGTLGVITEVTLRLYGIPETIAATTCAFARLGQAVETVVKTIQLGIPVARAELLDGPVMEAINRRDGSDYPVGPTLLFEFHGGPESVAEQIREVGEIASDCGSEGLAPTLSPQERSDLWHARHEALLAIKALRPGAVTWATDVCVPITALPEVIEATQREIAESGLLAPLAGHAGDGNFHLAFVLDPGDPEEFKRAAALDARMVARALEAGGTCTGEHGVGIGKIEFMRAEHGAGVDVMRGIKTALDPLGILNPGKVIPAAASTGVARPA